MATIANLAVGLIADTSKFAAGMNKAINKSKAFKMASSIAKKAANGMAVAITAATAALGFMVKKQFEAIDRTAKLSSVLGISTNQLLGLERAVKLSGGSIENLDTGFKRMTRNIADAEDGLSTSVRAFDKLGLSSERLMGMSVNDQFLAITDSLGKMTNVTERAATAQQLFGRSYSSIYPRAALTPSATCNNA